MFTSGGAPWGAHSYSGPYRALKQEKKILLVQLGDRQELISADRLKKHTGGVPVESGRQNVEGCLGQVACTVEVLRYGSGLEDAVWRQCRSCIINPQTDIVKMRLFNLLNKVSCIMHLTTSTLI